MPRIIWSESARQDLRGIDQYLSDKDPFASAWMLRTIRARADQLRDFPQSGPMIEDSLRSLTVRSTPFILVYRVEANGIEILRVRHARENWRAE